MYVMELMKWCEWETNERGASRRYIYMTRKFQDPYRYQDKVQDKDSMWSIETKQDRFWGWRLSLFQIQTEEQRTAKLPRE